MSLIPSFRDHSKQDWNSGQTTDHINAGSFQRIADACELMAKSYTDIIRDRDYYKKQSEERRLSNERMARSISSYRGVITRLKKKK